LISQEGAVAKSNAAKKSAARKTAQALAPVVAAALSQATQAVEDEVTASYIVLHPVSHDNDSYTRGETIDLTEEHAQPLLALGVIEAAPAEVQE
jgi:hypothetical protein